PAPVHHGDPVGERHDLVELAGDEQDGGAGVPLGDEPLVDELDGPDVHATGGLGGDEDAQRPGHLPGHDDLLLVPAGERGDGVGDVGEPDVELLGPPAGVVDDDVRQHGAPPGEGRGVVQVEDEVLGDREGGDDAA